MSRVPWRLAQEVVGGVGWGGATMGEAERKRSRLANPQEGLVAFTCQLTGWD